MTPDTPLYRMANRQAKGRLGSILRTAHRKGTRPERIARELYARYRIEVTGQTIRNWLATMDTEDAA